MGESATSNLLSFSGGLLEVFGYVASSLVLALYLVADRERARGSLFAVVPRDHHVKLARILVNLQTIVGGYMRGQLITSAVIFAFTFALLLGCRTPGALALAVFAALTDVIPFIGGLLAISPAFLATIGVGLWKGALVLVAMLLYQEFEELRVELPGDDSSNPVIEAIDARAERAYARQSVGAAPEKAAAVAGKIADETLQVEATSKPNG